MNFYRSCD